MPWMHGPFEKYFNAARILEDMLGHDAIERLWATKMPASSRESKENTHFFKFISVVGIFFLIVIVYIACVKW